jgi:hypothetical protein
LSKKNLKMPRILGASTAATEPQQNQDSLHDPQQLLPEAPDTIKILLTTDNHLGYLEKDPIRGADSFKAMQEIFELAIREKVGFGPLAVADDKANYGLYRCLDRWT